MIDAFKTQEEEPVVPDTHQVAPLPPSMKARALVPSHSDDSEAPTIVDEFTLEELLDDSSEQPLPSGGVLCVRRVFTLPDWQEPSSGKGFSVEVDEKDQSYVRLYSEGSRPGLFKVVGNFLRPKQH